MLIVLGCISVDEKVGKWHHFYLGALFLIAGIFLAEYFSGWLFLVGIVFIFIGVLLIGDDLFQHWMQAHYNSAYQSPIHRLGIPLYKFRECLIQNHPWWKWLNLF